MDALGGVLEVLGAAPAGRPWGRLGGPAGKRGGRLGGPYGVPWGCHGKPRRACWGSLGAPKVARDVLEFFGRVNMTNLGQFGANMNQHGPTWGQLGADIDQHGPNWANMVLATHEKSVFRLDGSTIFQYGHEAWSSQANPTRKAKNERPGRSDRHLHEHAPTT